MYAAKFAAGGKLTGKSDWQMDGRKDRKKTVKNSSGFSLVKLELK